VQTQQSLILIKIIQRGEERKGRGLGASRAVSNRRRKGIGPCRNEGALAVSRNSHQKKTKEKKSLSYSMWAS